MSLAPRRRARVTRPPSWFAGPGTSSPWRASCRSFSRAGPSLPTLANESRWRRLPVAQGALRCRGSLLRGRLCGPARCRNTCSPPAAVTMRPAPPPWPAAARGRDRHKLDTKEERADLRKQALDWLHRTDLKAYRRLMGRVRHAGADRATVAGADSGHRIHARHTDPKALDRCRSGTNRLAELCGKRLKRCGNVPPTGEACQPRRGLKQRRLQGKTKAAGESSPPAALAGPACPAPGCARSRYFPMARRPASKGDRTHGFGLPLSENPMRRPRAGPGRAASASATWPRESVVGSTRIGGTRST